MKPNIAIIDDETFYHKLWDLSLGKDSEIFTYYDFDEFIDVHFYEFNKFDYIIVDVLFGSNNILNTNFSKILRENRYTGDIILYSNSIQDIKVLRHYHFYDLFLNKDKVFTLEEIKSCLQLNRIDWKSCFKN